MFRWLVSGLVSSKRHLTGLRIFKSPWRHAAVISVDNAWAVWAERMTRPDGAFLRSPDLSDVLLAFRGVRDRAGGVPEAAVEEPLLDVLAVLVNLDHVGLDGKRGRPHVDPAEVLAADLQYLVAHVRRCRHAHGIDDGQAEVYAEQVAVVLAG